EAEQRELHHRQHEEHDERPAIAKDVLELLEQDRDERAPHQAFTASSSPRSRAARSVSATNTSSRDATIARAVAAKPAAARRFNSSSSLIVESISACTAWPNTVAPRQNGWRRNQPSARVEPGVSISRRRDPGWLTSGISLSRSGVPVTSS